MSGTRQQARAGEGIAPPNTFREVQRNDKQRAISEGRIGSDGSIRRPCVGVKDRKKLCKGGTPSQARQLQSFITKVVFSDLVVLIGVVA